jgi:hypothetical protein
MQSASDIRSARTVAVLVASGLIAAVISLALAPVGALAQVEYAEDGDWIVQIWGTTVKKATRVGTDPETEFYSLSVTRTEGQAKFLFDIAPDGSLIQTGGEGLYSPDPTWHLEGSYDGVSFNCDPPVEGTDFQTTISGTANESFFNFALDFPDASEHNESMECSENFTAFATTSQDLRDSLLFCGEVRVPSADSAEKTCKKTQIFFEDMSSPTSGRIKREITHDWLLLLRNRYPQGSPSPAPSGTGNPSPSPSLTPEPRPSPTDDGRSTNRRASLLVLERHLTASGAVGLAGWGDPDCIDSVPVRLQRRRANGSWATVASVTTDEAGLWSTNVRDRSGRYRALAPAVTKGQATCSTAASRLKPHRHG